VFRSAITCISLPQCSEARITHAHRSVRITDSVSFVYLPVQAAVAVDGEQLLLYLGLGLDLRVVLHLGRTRPLRARRLTRRTPVFQLAVRARGARRAEAFQLAVGARLALRAAVFHLAVRAGVAVHEDVFHLAVRAAVALSTVAFQLAVGAARARHAVVFYLAAQAKLPTSPFHHYTSFVSPRAPRLRSYHTKSVSRCFFPGDFPFGRSQEREKKDQEFSPVSLVRPAERSPRHINHDGPRARYRGKLRRRARAHR
jgi:hypothetical protein